MKTYRITSLGEQEICLTGRGSDSNWKEANLLSDFLTPWDGEAATNLEFRAINTHEHIYFLFKVKDSNIYIDQKDNSITSINNSERVELFFRTDDKLQPYYCLEIDPTPRIMSFKAIYYRQFDFNWEWPADGLQVKSYIGDEGYSVEICISKASLQSLDLLTNGKIETGIYRANFKQNPAGALKTIWTTWVDPKTKTPDFHLSSSFGILECS